MIRRAFAYIGLAAAALFPAPARAAVTSSQDLQRVCDEFYNLDLDAARVHDVAGATLVRDIATYRLTKGVLIFSKPIEGVTPAAVFVGEGSFTLTPVRKMDREMLTIAVRDRLKKDVAGMINTTFTEAFVLGLDKTWEELVPFLSPPRPATPQELASARKIFKGRLDVLDNIGARPELGLIARILAEPQEEAAFGVDVDTADYGWLAFAWSPGSTKEVLLAAREAVGAYYDVHRLVVAHRKSDLDASGRYAADPNADLHEVIKVKRYRMNLEIPDLQQINIDVDATFAPKVDGLKLVSFELVNDVQGPRWNSRAKWIDVLSVKDASGADIPFLHRKHRLLVLLKEEAPRDKEVTLNFRLNENTITQESNVHYSLLNTYAWFPQYGYLGGQYEIDWTVKTVKPLSVTGSGKVARSWEEGNFNAVQMVFEQPIQFPSLIFGRFKVEQDKYDSPSGGAAVGLAAHFWPKTVFMITDPNLCADLARLDQAPSDKCPIPFELDVPPQKPKDVLEEGKTIIKFMEELYGPFPYPKLDVAMMRPGAGFGQAPPSFIQLTGEAFMSPTTLDRLGGLRLNFFHGFFSHELAHQWWGHKIGWVADEDQWLSESFAEYSAGLFVLNYLGKMAFHEKMSEWKENARVGDPHGSIAWSNNLFSGPNGFRWYVGLIYNKGPYVVHMLRMQMGLENFKKAMQNVFAKHGYRNVSTEDIQRECELAAGYKLDYFFDQWFRGTGIPVFDYSWSSTPTEDGKHLVSVKMSQRDKQNYKQVLMPVYFYFRGQKEPLIRTRAVTRAEDLYQVKLPEKPARVVLDEDHDLLADKFAETGAAAQ